MGHARPHEGGSVSDRPDARELVEEVAAWLAGVLAPELDAGPRFQALVAAQGLAIAARDMQRARPTIWPTSPSSARCSELTCWRTRRLFGGRSPARCVAALSTIDSTTSLRP